MRGVAMSVKAVRAPSSPVLIAAGIALFLLATLGAPRAAAVAKALQYRVPVLVLAEGSIRDAIFGMALLYVALRRSKFAGTTAVIVATFLMFVIVWPIAFDLVAFASVHTSWWGAIYLAIAATLLWPSLFPWSWSANRPVFVRMGLTIAAITLPLGCSALLVRL
jgi:hypothetical protein